MSARPPTAERSFTALREDLTDLRSETRTGFTEMRGKFDHTAAGQDRIVALLNTLLDQDEHDAPRTRPLRTRHTPGSPPPAGGSPRARPRSRPMRHWAPARPRSSRHECRCAARSPSPRCDLAQRAGLPAS